MQGNIKKQSHRERETRIRKEVIAEAPFLFQPKRHASPLIFSINAMSVRAWQPRETMLLGLGMCQEILPLFCWLGCSGCTGSRSSSGKGGGRCAAGAWGHGHLGITQATLALCLIDVCRSFCGEIQCTDEPGSGCFPQHAKPGCMAYM